MMHTHAVDVVDIKYEVVDDDDNDVVGDVVYHEDILGSWRGGLAPINHFKFAFQVKHLVGICIYKEPLQVLHNTLTSLTRQRDAVNKISCAIGEWGD